MFTTLLVGEARALLVDTGTGIGDLAAAVREITELPLTVVNTHGHIDHSGGNYQFDAVYLHPDDFHLIREWSKREEKDHVVKLDPDHIPENFDAGGFYDYCGGNLRALEPDTVFDLGGLHVDVIPFQTHTRGSVGFLCRERKLLLTGDCISPVVYLVFPDSATVSEHIAMLESMRKLPFSVMLSSHCEQLLGKERIEFFLRCAKELDPEKTIRFRNPFFPQYRERMFVYEDPDDSERYAALVYAKDKLDTGGNKC